MAGGGLQVEMGSWWVLVYVRSLSGMMVTSPSQPHFTPDAMDQDLLVLEITHTEGQALHPWGLVNDYGSLDLHPHYLTRGNAFEAMG